METFEARVPLFQCPMGRSQQSMGREDETVAIYSTNLELKYHGDPMGARHCHNLDTEMNILSFTDSQVYLQNGRGKPMLKVNCDREAVCMRNLLQDLPSDKFQLFGANRIDPEIDVQQTFNFPRESFTFSVCNLTIDNKNAEMYNVGKMARICDESHSLLVGDTGKLHGGVAIEITFPEYMIITGMHVIRDYKTFTSGHVSDIGRIVYEVPPELGGDMVTR